MTGPRVAIAQAPSVTGRLDVNPAQAVSLISPFARAGADLVILPELFLSGYDMEGLNTPVMAHLDLVKQGGDPVADGDRAAARRGERRDHG